MVKLTLRKLREERRLTLAQVADQIGVSVPHVSELERGKKRINNDWLEKFAEFYDVPVRALFEDEAAADIAETLLSMEKLEGDDRARVKAFAQGLVNTSKANAKA